MNIDSIGGINQQISPKLPTGASKPGNFASLVQQYVQQTNQDTKAAQAAAVDLAVGKSSNVSETLLAVQKADLSFQLMMSVRNKLVDAYREVMRMQV
jgi:flagellar hook-basal body complex protein FliE